MAKLHKYVPQTPVTMFLYAVQKPSKCPQINCFPKQPWGIYGGLYLVTKSQTPALLQIRLKLLSKYFSRLSPKFFNPQ